MQSFPLIGGLALAVLPAAYIAVGAAAAPPRPQQSAASPASPAADSTVLRTYTNLVLVDVVVTEKGSVAHGLDRSRFHVLEDGHEQPITSFEEHIPGSAPPVAAALALPPHTYTNAPLYPEATAVNVLLLDGLNTPLDNQEDLRQQVLKFLRQPGSRGPMAIFTLTSRLRMIRGVTGDATELAAALESPAATAQPSTVLNPTDPQSLNARTAELAASGQQIALIQQELATSAAFQTDQRVRMTLDALRQLARYLSAIPGRKNVVWFSGSFPISLDPNDQLIDPLRMTRNYTEEVLETSRLLAAARVAVYPVDARGVMTQSSAAGSYRPPADIEFGRVNLPAPAKDDVTQQHQTVNENASMNQIADVTGGRAFTHTNDLAGALEEAIRDGSSYYTIGYVPPEKKSGDQFRRIRLKIEGSGYSLAYRKGYYAVPPDKTAAAAPGEASLLVAAVVHGAPPATQILFKARVLDAADPSFQGVKLPEGPAGDMAARLKGPTRRYIAELDVDAHTIVFSELPDGQRRVQLEFAIVGFEFDGKRLNYLSRSFDARLNPAQFAQLMAGGVRVRMALDLPQGQAYLRIAVDDIAGGRAGALEVPLDGKGK